MLQNLLTNIDIVFHSLHNSPLTAYETNFFVWISQADSERRDFAVISFCLYAEPGQCSRYSYWLRAGRPRGQSSSPGVGKNFLFFTLS
jgi:hypothetical protein